MKPIAFSLLIGAACAGFAPAVVADSKIDAKTPSTKFFVTVHGHMTQVSGSPLEATLAFSGPVQLPRITLPAGTYLFSMAPPNTMRVSSQDGTKVFGTFTTMSVTRTKDLHQPLVRFERTTADAPPRFVAIFPENASVGFQLLFPVAQRQAGAPVASTGAR